MQNQNASAVLLVLWRLLCVPAPDHGHEAAAFDCRLPFFFSFVCKDIFIIERMVSIVKKESRTFQKKKFLI